MDPVVAPAANAAAYLAARLAALTGRTWHHQYAQTHLYNNVTPEGVGLVHAFTPVGQAVRDLPSPEFPRKAVASVFATPVGIVVAASSHFSPRTDNAAAREEQTKRLIDFMNEQQNDRVALALIGADLNATPEQAPANLLTAAAFLDVWATAQPGSAGATHPSHSATRRIDYLFARGSNVRVQQASVEFGQPYSGTSYVSDHRGVFGTLQVP